MTQPETLDTTDINTALGAFLTSLKALGEATKGWKCEQTEANARVVDEAAHVVDLATGILAEAVLSGTAQTRGEIDAWRARRRLVFGDSAGGVLGLVTGTDPTE